MKAVEERGAGEGPVEDLAVLREEVPAAVGSADHTPHAATDKHRVVEGAAAADATDRMTERPRRRAARVAPGRGLPVVPRWPPKASPALISTETKRDGMPGAMAGLT